MAYKGIKYRHWLLFSLLLILLISSFGHAFSINFQDCYMPWEFGDAEKDYIMVRPLGNKCHKICQNQCQEFSRSSKIGLTGAELNQDIIDKCILKCQQGGSGTGTTYTSKYRIKDDNSSNILGWKWSAKTFTTNTSCTVGESDPESADFAYYPIDFTVKKGDVVYIDLAGSDSGYGNTVFLGGFETKRITPYKFYPNTILDQNGDPSWNARSNKWYDTGIKIEVGDYIRVAYGGKFLGNYNNRRYIPRKDDLDLSFNGDCDGKDYFPGEALSSCFYKSKEKKAFCTDGNNQDINCENNGCEEIMANTQSEHKFCSLGARRNSIVRKSLWVNGKSKDDYQLDQFQFQGYILDITTKNKNLQIRYKDNMSHYSDNVGGYEVEISRKSCPHHGGIGLQYAIVPAVKDDFSGQMVYKPWAPEVSWKDAKGYLNKSENDGLIPIDKEGKIYFRIDPSKIEGERFATSGSYGVIVSKKETDSDKISGIISDVINTVTEFFIGDGGNSSNSGKVQYIFNTVIEDPKIINTIRGLLIFYIAYTGLSYMVGFAKTTQQEAMKRILKVSLIVILISPNSWAFFNTYLFSFFLNGGMELTYDIVQPLMSGPTVNVETATHAELVKAVFSMYDQIFHQLFNPAIWTKIWSLVCTSLVGILLAILIIIAIISYIICVMRVATIYLISIITLCILFILAPVFISFILFEKTNKLFVSWINNMLSMMFQPVFSFVAIALLHAIFIMVLHTSLNFTACPTCLLSFNIFQWYLCLPAKNVWWVALYGAHFPLEASVSSPVSLFAPVIAITIMAQAMDGMVKFASKMANTIATNSFVGFDLGGVAGAVQDYTADGAKWITETALGVNVAGKGGDKKDKDKKEDGKKGDGKQGGKTKDSSSNGNIKRP